MPCTCIHSILTARAGRVSVVGQQAMVITAKLSEGLHAALCCVVRCRQGLHL